MCCKAVLLSQHNTDFFRFLHSRNGINCNNCFHGNNTRYIHSLLTNQTVDSSVSSVYCLFDDDDDNNNNNINNYSMAQQPLESFDFPLMRVSLSILLSIMFLHRREDFS